MKHKFKPGDLVMVKLLDEVSLGIILSFPETNSMYAGYARVQIIAQLDSKPESHRSTHKKNGREHVFAISHLAIATTDTINNFLVTHGFK
jgi:hypothetical protein